MDAGTTGGSEESLRPIVSLISKSEKAQQKLLPGSWQHTMLQNNLRALRIASALMSKEAGDGSRFKLGDLQKALSAVASMIGRAEKAHAGLRPGTSQHTLLLNRLKALRIAEGLMMKELGQRDA